ncbi:MAG: hypothetical protein N4A64_02655 [Marinisporobacter sp.]|jgi:hypothetical protein|nr:hypothetical protein [Marinisporobacter sp.]
MIINPPEDVYELKTVIEKYYKNNHINRETMVKKNKKGHIEVYFYRKSSDKNDYGAVIEEVEYINDEIVE